MTEKMIKMNSLIFSYLESVQSTIHIHPVFIPFCLKPCCIFTHQYFPSNYIISHIYTIQVLLYVHVGHAYITAMHYFYFLPVQSTMFTSGSAPITDRAIAQFQFGSQQHSVELHY